MHGGRGTFQGELLALRWRDVDWLAGRLRVRLVVFEEDARPMLTHESHPPQHGAEWVLWLVTAEDVVVDHFIGGDVELVEQHGAR